MGTMNKVFLCGRLGRNPEVAFLQSGTAKAKFSVATDEGDGKGGRVTTWHNCVCFGKEAQTAGEHLHKGEQVLVEGRLDVRQYEDKAGVKKTAVEIIVNRLTLLPNGPREAKGGYVAPPEDPHGEAGADGISEDEIPF